MKSKRHGLAFLMLSVSTAIVGGLAVYVRSANPSTVPAWFPRWVFQYEAQLALATFVLVVFNAIVEGFRSYLGTRHQTKAVLQKIVDDLSKTCFQDGSRFNRITLFNKTTGWRIFIWVVIRAVRQRKWLRLLTVFRINLFSSYLGAYIRPPGVRNPISTAAFRVSDDGAECEGIAGLVWENLSFSRSNLPKIDRAAIRACKSMTDLPAEIRNYAKESNVSNLMQFKSFDSFPRHYYGVVIRQSDGAAWGVLLMDSTDDTCPWVDGNDFKPEFVWQFNTIARIISKIVE